MCNQQTTTILKTKRRYNNNKNIEHNNAKKKLEKLLLNLQNALVGVNSIRSSKGLEANFLSYKSMDNFMANKMLNKTLCTLSRIKQYVCSAASEQ